MPLHLQITEANAELIIWKFDASENFDDLMLSESDLPKTENYHPKKKAEFLMVRRILSEKFPGEKIVYDGVGQPFLENSAVKISISHSFPLAGIAFSKERIGFDMEPVREKITRLKDKFIEEAEQKFIPKHKEAEYLTVIWSVKEGLYKLHHSKHWSLKKHYEVRPFALEDEEISCRVHDENFSENYAAKIYFLEDFVLTVVQ